MEELSKEFKADPDAWNSKYQFKPGRVKGTIRYLSGDSGAINLLAPDQFDVGGTMNDPSKFKDHDLNYGQEVVLEGTFFTLNEANVALTDMKVVETKPYQRPAQPPTWTIQTTVDELLTELNQDEAAFRSKFQLDPNSLTHHRKAVLITGKVKQVGNLPEGSSYFKAILAGDSEEADVECTLARPKIADGIKEGQTITLWANIGYAIRDPGGDKSKGDVSLSECTIY